MAIDFPALPSLADVDPQYVDFGGKLVPPTGGKEQWILRLGDRFQVAVALPTMDADCAGKWLGAQLRQRASGATLVLTMPQSGGPASVTGSGSLNSDAMTISGGTPLVGQLFSFAAGGRNYLHMVTSISGGSITVAPRLRAAASSAALDFVTPKLEGFLEGDTAWSIKRLRWIGQNFTLRENR